MDLFILTTATDRSAAAVSSAASSATVLEGPDDFPQLTLGESMPLSVTHLSALGTVATWSADPTYTVRADLGELTVDGLQWYAGAALTTVSGSAKTGSLALTTTALLDAARCITASCCGRRRASLSLTLQITVTDPALERRVYAQLPVTINLRVPPVGTATPAPAANYLTAAEIDARLITKPGIDAAGYGFSPSATAADNRAALQRALDAGAGYTVYVSVPGEYALDATCFYDAGTRLLCARGVIFSKASAYGEVLLNKGALTRTYTDAAEIVGLTIQTNGFGGESINVYGMRCQLGGFYVSNFVVRDFTCLDIEENCFAIQVVKFRDIRLTELLVQGEKDGVHLTNGTGYYVAHVVGRGVFDDLIALNAKDYVDITPELGSLTYGLIEDIRDEDDADTTGNCVRILTGSWGDYSNGLSVRRGDAVVVDGARIYRVANAVGSGTFTTSVKPTHTTPGQIVTGADNIAWVYVQAGAFYSCDIADLVIRDATLLKDRPAFSLAWEDDTFERSVYPGTEAVSQIRNLSLENIIDRRPNPGLFMGGAGNLVSARVVDCDLGSVSTFLTLTGADRGAHTTQLTLQGVRFRAMPTAAGLNLTRPNLALTLTGSANIAASQFTIGISGSGTTVRAPFLDLPVLHTVLTPSAGDYVRGISTWYHYTGSAWIALPPQALATDSNPRFAYAGLGLAPTTTTGTPRLQVAGSGGNSTGFFNGGNSDTVPFVASGDATTWTASNNGHAFLDRASDGHFRWVRRNGSTTNADVLNLSRSTGAGTWYSTWQATHVGVGIAPNTESASPRLQVEGSSAPSTGFFGGGNSDTVPVLASGNQRTWSTASNGWAIFDRGTDGHFRLIRRNGSTTNVDVLNVSRSTGAGTWSGAWTVSGNTILTLPASAPTLDTNSTVTLELTSNTSLTIKVRGTDGTTRSVALTLS